jgi:alanine-glyoxylate transaminase / serine-glyoxylate transaminase / serine-pyruvate transaminase
VQVPDGIDAKAVARQLLTDYNIEIGGGLGELAGQVWRVGLMGFNSRRETVITLLGALAQVLHR